MQRGCQLLTSSKRLILMVGLRKHLPSCQNCQRDVDASLLKTSFVNTPQRSLTLSLINCRSTLSPCAPMAVRLRRSHDKFAPMEIRSGFLARRREFDGPGWDQLTSTTSRQRRGLSTIEILNMRISPRPSDCARHMPKG